MKAKKPVIKPVASAAKKSVAPEPKKVSVKADAVEQTAASVNPAASAKPVGKAPAARKPAVKKPAAATVAKEVKAPKAEKKPKLKVVRDSFTMPQSEYQKIAELKEICLKDGLQVKKSEVLRAGLKALCAMDAEQIKIALNGLDKIKTGRPNKH